MMQTRGIKQFYLVSDYKQQTIIVVDFKKHKICKEVTVLK